MRRSIHIHNQMTTGKNILKPKHITFPEYYREMELNSLTYKWDQIPKEDWIPYANTHGIPYKDLFEDMNKQGLLYPVILRDLKSNGVYRKYQCGGRRIIWAKLHHYTHIGSYVVPDWITIEGRQKIDEIIKDQWFRID